MPDPKQSAPVPMIRVENRSRSIWMFGATDRQDDLVVGDAAMTPQVMASKGARYDARCPAPVATVAKSVIDGWPDGVRKTFDALVAKGDLQVTPVAA